MLLRIISAQISWKDFFSKKNFFQRFGAFLQLQNHWFGPHFFPQKHNFVVFFKCAYLILIQ